MFPPLLGNVYETDETESVWMKTAGEGGDVITGAPPDPVSYKNSYKALSLTHMHTHTERLFSNSLGEQSSFLLHPRSLSLPDSVCGVVGSLKRPWTSGEVWFWLTVERRLADTCVRPKCDLLIGLLVFIRLAETGECWSEEVGEERVWKRDSMLVRERTWSERVNVACCHLHFLSEQPLVCSV